MQGTFSSFFFLDSSVDSSFLFDSSINLSVCVIPLALFEVEFRVLVQPTSRLEFMLALPTYRFTHRIGAGNSLPLCEVVKGEVDFICQVPNLIHYQLQTLHYQQLIDKRVGLPIINGEPIHFDIYLRKIHIDIWRNTQRIYITACSYQLFRKQK